MRFVQPGFCALLLAAGSAWAAWLVNGYRPEDVTAAGLGLTVGASLLAYFACDRKDAFRGVRLGLYGGGLAVGAASFWTGIVRPLQHAPSFGAVMAWLDRLDGVSLVLLVVPGPAVVLLTVLWFEVAMASLRHFGGGERRRRAESELHGHASLLGRRFLRKLARRKGILLGQWGAGRNAPLIGWSLEGSAITVAPPPHRQGGADRAQPAHAGQAGLGRIDRHHRPQRRALVHRVAAAAGAGAPRGASRPLRGGEDARQRVRGLPSARCAQCDLQPAGVHPGRRQPCRARHQRPARRPAHTAPPGSSRQHPALLRVGPRHRRGLHGVGAVQGAAVQAHAQNGPRDALGLARGARGLRRGLQEGGAFRGGLGAHRGRAPGPGRQGGRGFQLHHGRQPIGFPQLPGAARQHRRDRASIR